MPSTGYFAGGPLHCFTVFPHRDLFVLQTDDLDRVEWSRVGHDMAFLSTLPDFIGIKHIAIEYNPEWGIQMLKGSDFCGMDIVRTLNEGASDAEGFVWKIWLIDHSLKRKADAPAFEEKTSDYVDLNVFYASDRKLLEVEWNGYSDPKENWRYIKPAGDTSDDCWTWSTYFVRRLDEEIRSNMYDDYSGTNQDACNIRLLGWDDL
ncbi:hypothetical protein FSARC_4256 [Fusarium sarcochroum]|uniref:Uncharacterized protein n=1 Tax=Fusarium sarcochroum TaxID=1208366 RepID=A0A8H4XBN3_9HYPO|nr:hypothetical protein FSARC_4256 [Fusarium sarcochroum]